MKKYYRLLKCFDTLDRTETKEELRYKQLEILQNNIKIYFVLLVIKIIKGAAALEANIYSTRATLQLALILQRL